jgi:malonyl CoA-acyl carrier protein transacylase
MTCYLFPGQGSQKRGMGENLFDQYPQMAELASDILGYSIRALCLEDVDRQLHQTQYTQPALYVVNAMAYRQKLEETGKVPEFVAGHSLGEYNALEAAGAFGFEQGLELVKKRGELMSRALQGSMAAIVGPSPDAVTKCLEANDLSTIDIANSNSPKQTVIAGSRDDLKRAEAALATIQATFIPLSVSGAFHSRYMAQAGAEFEEHLDVVELLPLRIPVIANVTARPYRQDQIAQCLAKQISHPVRWLESMQYLLAQGETNFEELGVGNVLTKLMVAIRNDYVPSGPANAVKAIESWNERVPVGARVRVDGHREFMVTRTPALVLFGHRAAVYLQGYNGYFALNDVHPLERPDG